MRPRTRTTPIVLFAILVPAAFGTFPTTIPVATGQEGAAGTTVRNVEPEAGFLLDLLKSMNAEVLSFRYSGEARGMSYRYEVVETVEGAPPPPEPSGGSNGGTMAIFPGEGAIHFAVIGPSEQMGRPRVVVQVARGAAKSMSSFSGGPLWFDWKSRSVGRRVMGDRPMRVEAGKEYTLVEYEAREIVSADAEPKRPARLIKLALKVKFEDHPPAAPGGEAAPEKPRNP